MLVREFGLSTREVGELLGVSASTVRCMAHEGEFTFYWVRGQMRFDLEDIKSWKEIEKEKAWQYRNNCDVFLNTLDNDDIINRHWKYGD